MTHKLSEDGALRSAEQMVKAIGALQARHGWSDADTVAVAVAAITEIVVRRVGLARAVELFRDHAEAMADEHERRSRI